MGLLGKQKYSDILKKIRMIESKNNELIESNQYLIDSINSNFLIDDKGVNQEETKYIFETLKNINFSINSNLVPKIQIKIQSGDYK